MMKAGVWALAAAALANAVELTVPPVGAEIIPGQYIAQVRANMTDSAHAALAAKWGLRKHKIGSTFRAVSGGLDDAALAELLGHGDVLTVEHDAVMRAMQGCPASQTEPVSWGQVRTTDYSPSADMTFAYNPTWGTGVDVYILDTGIRCSHSEFQGGRCIWGANFAGGANNDVDGHGTHCAGTVVGATYGLAKAGTVIAVKVLGDNGSGSVAGIVEGCEWSVQQSNSRNRPGVLSLSLGGGASAAMDNAVNAVFDAGKHVAVASGNSNGNACNYSPARAERAITVSSTELANSGGQMVDAKSSFSNWGPCVDIWAPGTSITSAGVSSDTAYATFSGTSMACPHVAGALAIHLTTNPTATPAAAKTTLVNGATDGIIRNVDSTSPNKLLHVQC